MTAPGVEAFKRHRITWATYGLVGFFAYLETILGPVMLFVRKEQDLSFTVASLHFSAFAAGGLVTGLVGDRLIGKLGRGFALWGGGLGMAAGAIGLFAGGIAPVTIGGCFVAGWFGSLMLVTTQAVLSDRHGRWSAVAITESNAVASVFAVAASGAVGVSVAAGLGWRAALVPALATLILLYAAFRSAPTGSAQLSAGDRAERSLPLMFWAYALVVFLGVAAEWSVGYWGASFIAASANISEALAAGAMGAFFGAMLVGRLLASMLARRVGAPTLLVMMLSVAAGGFLPLWLSPVPVVALVGLILVGLGLSGVYPIGVSVAVATVPMASDTAATRLAIAGSAAVLLAPLAIGRIADALGIVKAYGFVGVVLAGAVLAAAAGRNRRAVQP